MKHSVVKITHKHSVCMSNNRKKTLESPLAWPWCFINCDRLTDGCVQTTVTVSNRGSRKTKPKVTFRPITTKNNQSILLKTKKCNQCGKHSTDTKRRKIRNRPVIATENLRGDLGRGNMQPTSSARKPPRGIPI